MDIKEVAKQINGKEKEAEKQHEIPEGSKVCGNCPFWHLNALQFGPNGGECRKEPPKIFAITIPGGRDMQGRPLMQTQMQTLFPATDILAWCGCHPAR